MNTPRVPLRRVLKAVKTGATPPSEQLRWLSDGAIPWYAPGDVGESLRLAAPARTVKADALSGGWLPRFPTGSTLLVGIGNVGRVAFLDHDASGNQQLTCLVPGPRIVPRFLAWQLWAMQDEVRATAPFTILPILNNEFVRSLLLTVPPRATQHAIVDYLDRETARIDALIAAKRRMVELLEERFLLLLQSLVDPSDPLARGGVSPLKYLARIERGVFSHRPRNDPAYYEGPYPFIQTGDVARAGKYVQTHAQTLNQRGLAVSRMFPAGTLTMVIAANIGDVGITTFAACFPDSVVGIEADARILDSNYLYFALLAAKRRLVEMAPVTTQANLNVERIGALSICCPSLESQHAVATRLDVERLRVDSLAEAELRSVSLLKERRQALITAAVTGQLDIPAAA